MRTLYLIDGYAQFFRAYHAIRTPMSSPVTGEPTNMTFGFVGMLLKLLRGEGGVGGKPAFVAVALDVSGDRGTFRSELYTDYKANRPPPPEDLEKQVDRCLSIMRSMGIPLLGVPGFEADDVLATIVRRLQKSEADLRIRMISKDKDLKQLLQGTSGQAPVELFDIHTDVAIGEESLLADTGLKPSQVVDMLTLMGDTVDNVPGVEGVGEKTAALLIREWGTLDNLIAHAAEIKGKRGEKLREAIPRLALSKTLVTLRDDVEVDFELASSATERFDLGAMMPHLKECGFNRYQEELRTLMGVAPTVGDSPAAARPSTPSNVEIPKPKRRSEPVDFGPSLFDRSDEQPPVIVTAQSGEYQAVTTKAGLDALVAELKAAPIFAFDTETTSLVPRDAALCGISVSTKPGTGFYVPIRSPDPTSHLDEPTVLEALRPLLEDATRLKCGHNLKYDLLVLRNAGVELRGLATAGSCDSMVASYLVDASRSSHSLDSLSLALLGRTNISITELIGSGKNQRSFAAVPVNAATIYAAEDSDAAIQLHNVMMPQLKSMGLDSLMGDVEMPLVEVLAELEWNGISVNAAELDKQRARLEISIDELLKRLAHEFSQSLGRGVDPDSPKQLSVALFNKPTDDPPGLGIKGQKRTKTGFSTDAEVLESLAEDDSITTPIPALVLEYRQLSKLVSTYLVALKAAIHPATGRIHASFSQTVAVTGRLASSDPNLQNIPIRTEVGREIRRAFVAAPGKTLVTADYSQIELRLLAHLSRDPALIEAFERGDDIHAAVAAQIHGVPLTEVSREQRSGAKMVNFGIVYGITAFGLARRLKIGEREAATIIDGYKRRFAGITTFLQECIEQARSKGYVETMLLRRRPIPDIDSTNASRRAFAERTAINSVVQGSAADLIKLAMVDLHARLCPRAAHRRNGAAPEIAGVDMLLQIHDELVFEVDLVKAEQARELIVRRMEAAMSLRVPLKADAHIAPNWFDGK